MRKPGVGINPLINEPFHLMFGPGAGVSKIIARDTRAPVSPAEPILLLRAVDPAAVRAAYAYADELAKTDAGRAAEVRQHADRMAAYLQHARKGAVPGR